MSLNSTCVWHCHICDLDVPITHIQDHNDSWEHEAYVSICQEAMKRLNKHINPKKQITDDSKNTDSYFCYICSVIVNNDESNLHVQSKRHNESKIKEKLLDNFLKIYIDGSYFNKMLYDGVKSNIIEMFHLYDSSVLKTNELTETNNGDKSDETKEQVQDNKKCNNVKVETIECKVEKDNEPLSGIDDINKTIGITGQADNPKQLCDICKVKIPDNNWSGHENGKKHKLKLLKMNEEALPYQMQLSKSAFTINCRICNTEVCHDAKSIETHLESSEHTTKYENLLKANSIVKSVNRLACITCGMYVETKHELRHIDSPKHKGFNHKFSSYTITDLEIQESNLIHCKVCETKVSNKPTKMLNHLKNDLHRVGRSLLLSRHKIKPFGILERTRNFHNCDWCNEEFDAGTLHEHISSESHQIHVQKLVEYETKVITHYMRFSKCSMRKLEKLECLICDDNKFIYTSNRWIHWHIYSCVHQDKHNNLLIKNKVEKISDDFHCNLCDVHVEAFQDLIHIKSDSHRKKLLDFNNSDVND